MTHSLLENPPARPVRSLRRRVRFGVLLALGLSFAACPASDEPEWTTSSPAAHDEFLEGLEAELRLYGTEARRHFERALEEDPDFVMAQLKIFVRTSNRAPEYETLKRHLETADLDSLTEREAFLVEFFLLRRSRHYDEAVVLLSSYLERNPDDPYALDLRCEGIWESGHWDEAEQCYHDLLAADPNWVAAQNRLGYLAMAQGHFEQAEERFRNYRYVAPDQANPHDSLGELLVLVGRYDEARKELRRALSIRPDFCASYQNLATLALYESDVEGALAVADESAENGCPPGIRQRLRCQVAGFSLFLERDWEALVARWDDECHKSELSPTWLPHLGALNTGQFELARTMEASVLHKPSSVLKYEQAKEQSPDYLSLVGTRFLVEGDYEAAVDHLAAADDLLDYWGLGPGMYKVYNRLIWVEALRRSGQMEAADERLESVRQVNAQMADNYVEGWLSWPFESAGETSDRRAEAQFESSSAGKGRAK